MRDCNRIFGIPGAAAMGLMIAAMSAGCADHPASKPPPPAAMPPPVAIAPPPTDDPAAPLTDRIARALVRTCPPADGSSAPARDSAALALGRLDLLLNACEDRVLWGIHDPATPIDPGQIMAAEFTPLVMAKLYLSLFTFPGVFETRRDGDYTVVEIAAHFRAALPLGDYPHPVWHSPDEWDAYAGTSALQLVFNGDKLSAVYIKKPADHAAAKQPVWDEHWHWNDAAGAPQPRVTEYAYLFSPDNPNIQPLATAYRRVQGALRAQGCLACHSPDNKHQAPVLMLLGYPNQALTVHHALPAILRENAMPPGDLRHGKLPGIANEPARREFIDLAQDFERVAEAAMLFESDARGVPRKPPVPVRPPPEH